MCNFDSIEKFEKCLKNVWKVTVHQKYLNFKCDDANFMKFKKKDTGKIVNKYVWREAVCKDANYNDLGIIYIFTYYDDTILVSVFTIDKQMKNQTEI